MVLHAFKAIVATVLALSFVSCSMDDNEIMNLDLTDEQFMETAQGNWTAISAGSSMETDENDGVPFIPKDSRWGERFVDYITIEPGWLTVHFERQVKVKTIHAEDGSETFETVSELKCPLEGKSGRSNLEFEFDKSEDERFFYTFANYEGEQNTFFIHPYGDIDTNKADKLVLQIGAYAASKGYVILERR